jgi:chromosome segregation ATPase
VNEKTDYIEKVKTQAAECAAEVEHLSQRAREVSGDTRDYYEEQIADLRRKCSSLSDRLADMEWGREAWDDARQGVQNALDALRDAIEKVRSRAG